MPDITVQIPSVGMQAYFTFKEPFATYVKNKFNVNPAATKLKVISVISLLDTIRNDLRDPYTDLYSPASLSEVAYKKDLTDNIPVVSFAYTDSIGVDRYVRVPVNYIESISSVSDVEYINKLILIDLNRLPLNADTTLFFSELKTFIETRLGVNPDLKEVSVGEVEMVSTQEHEMRETIRGNTRTVYKTLETRYAELQLSYQQLVDRLTALNISLS